MKVYGIPKFNIVIPTWNSMPELGLCLQSIKDSIPGEYINKIIVVDRESTDGTIEYAQSLCCTVLFDTVSLGSARLSAINYSQGVDILFIDSDIIVTREWWENMLYLWINNRSFGMLFGRTVDSGKFGIIKKDKIQRDFNMSPLHLLKKGDRGYTHNTFIRCDLLNDISDLSCVNSWEDFLITQHIINKGFLVIETPCSVIHQHNDICSAKVGWCIRGMFDTHQPLYRILGTHLYYLFEGFRSFICHSDIDFLRWGILNFLDGFTGYFKHNFKRGAV